MLGVRLAYVLYVLLVYLDSPRTILAVFLSFDGHNNKTNETYIK